MLEFINQGWVGSIIGLVGVILGVLGLIAYRVSRIGPRPTYQLQSRRLIGKQEQELPDEVEIHFNNKPVPRLTLSRIIFWNSGNSTILGNQIVQDDPICLDFENGNILKAHIIKSSREAIKFNVKTSENASRVNILFDFLDPNDGATIEVLHTSEARNPNMLGTIRGVPQGVVSWGEVSPRFYNNSHSSKKVRVMRRINRWLFAGMILIGICIITYSMLPDNLARMIHEALKSEEKVWSFHIGKRIGIFLLGSFYLLPPIMLFWLRRPRYPKNLQVED